MSTNRTTPNLTTPTGGLTDSAYAENQHLTITEVAELCGVSRDTIKRRNRENKFPKAWQTGEDRHWLIPVQDLVAAGLIQYERVARALDSLEEARDRKESDSRAVQIAELITASRGLQNQLTQALAEIEFLHSLVQVSRAV